MKSPFHGIDRDLFDPMPGGPAFVEGVNAGLYSLMAPSQPKVVEDPNKPWRRMVVPGPLKFRPKPLPIFHEYTAGSAEEFEHSKGVRWAVARMTRAFEEEMARREEAKSRSN